MFYQKRINVLKLLPSHTATRSITKRPKRFLSLGKKGLEPLTLRLSGVYSYLLSYLPICEKRCHPWTHCLEDLVSAVLHHELKRLDRLYIT